MSDVGPFVAAALDDKEIQELLEENERLQCEVHNARDVVVMADSQCYGRGRLEDGKIEDGMWKTNISCSSFFLEEFGNLEIHLAGVRLIALHLENGANSVQGWVVDNPEHALKNEDVKSFLHFKVSDILWLLVEIDTSNYMLARQFRSLCSRIPADLLHTFLIQSADFVPSTRIQVVSVSFYAATVREILPQGTFDEAATEAVDLAVLLSAVNLQFHADDSDEDGSLESSSEEER